MSRSLGTSLSSSWAGCQSHRDISGSSPRREPCHRAPVPPREKRRRTWRTRIQLLLIRASSFLLGLDWFRKGVAEFRLRGGPVRPPQRRQVLGQFFDFLVAQGRRTKRWHLRVWVEPRWIFDVAVHPARGVFEPDVGEFRRVRHVGVFLRRLPTGNRVAAATLLLVKQYAPSALGRCKRVPNFLWDTGVRRLTHRRPKQSAHATVTPPSDVSAIGRCTRDRMLRRSKNGSSNKTSTSSVGTPIATKLSIEPGTNFKSWKNGRKYHSGRGTYAESVGSAGASSPAPKKRPRITSSRITAVATIMSFAIMSGQNRTPLALDCAYFAS